MNMMKHVTHAMYIIFSSFATLWPDPLAWPQALEWCVWLAITGESFTEARKFKILHLVISLFCGFGEVLSAKQNNKSGK